MSAFLVKLDENLSQAHVEFLNGVGYSVERETDEDLSIAGMMAGVDGRSA
jgi:hypothetical protein